MLVLYTMFTPCPLKIATDQFVTAMHPLRCDKLSFRPPLEGYALEENDTVYVEPEFWIRHPPACGKVR